MVIETRAQARSALCTGYTQIVHMFVHSVGRVFSYNALVFA